MIAKAHRIHFAAPIAMAAILAALVLAPAARAGSYIVAQCSPGLFPEAPEAGFASTSSHFTQNRDCNQGANGVQIGYALGPNETGTEANRYAMWVWQAPAGTYITGGSAYSRLASEDGIHGYLAVSPDSGAGVATEDQNDDQLHLSAIPAGDWRYFEVRLECTQPNEGGRCAGPGSGAHAYLKQLRLQLTDVVAPSISVGGSLLSGAIQRGSQTLSVAAADQGAGLASVQIAVNGKVMGGEDLAAACNPLPGNLTARMAPCPPSFAKTYTLNTEDAPFVNGANTVALCAYDYAQSGVANSTCSAPSTVDVDDSCADSPVGGGHVLSARFVRSETDTETLRHGRAARVKGRLTDSSGNAVPKATICVETHTIGIASSPTALSSVETNSSGRYSYRVPTGPDREIVVGYRNNAFQLDRELRCYARVRPLLRAKPRRLSDNHRVHFRGRLPGPHRRGRVVIVQANVRGARRWITFRRATTDSRGEFSAAYHFDATTHTTAYRFRALVPHQAGYPWKQGHSAPVAVVVRG